MPETFPLALVTGAAHRLGKAFALTLARRGYAILLHHHTAVSEAAHTADELRALGVPVFPVQADLADEARITALFSRVDEILADPASGVSRLGVLVNSAAVLHRADARTLSIPDFDATLDINLRAPFLCAREAFARMGPGSLIVNVSDVAAQKVWTGFPAYTVSKAGIETLTRIQARSFAPHVRVNAIAPGLVLPSDDMPLDDWERLVGRLPLKRAAALEEIAYTLEFLLQNEYITGQTIVVDGGYSLL